MNHARPATRSRHGLIRGSRAPRASAPSPDYRGGVAHGRMHEYTRVLPLYGRICYKALVRPPWHYKALVRRSPATRPSYDAALVRPDVLQGRCLTRGPRSPRARPTGPLTGRGVGGVAYAPPLPPPPPAGPLRGICPAACGPAVGRGGE
jgi:hypothetical protein